MNLYQYQRAAVRTEKLLPIHNRFTHARLGMVTELGEFVTEAKRVLIYDAPLFEESRIKHIKEELGDTMWYCAIPFNTLDKEMMLPDQGLSFLAMYIGQTMNGISTDALTLQDRVYLLDVLAGELAIEVGHYAQNVRNHVYHPALVNTIRIIGLIRDTCDLLGVDFEKVLDENIEKLKKRFPDAFSSEAAEARADKGGIDARHS